MPPDNPKQVLKKRLKAGLLELVLVPLGAFCLWLLTLVVTFAPIPFIYFAIVSWILYSGIILYLLFRDRLFEGRGVFRDLLSLRVIDNLTGERISGWQSFCRNWMFAVPAALALLDMLCYVPVRYHLDTLGICGYAGALIVEGVTVLIRRDMRRLGDLMAGTRVVAITALPAPSKRTTVKKVFAYFLLALVVLFAAFGAGVSILYRIHQKQPHLLLCPTAHSLKISPDGKWAAFRGWLWPATRAPLFIVNLASGDTWSAEYYDKWEEDYPSCWSKDGKSLLFSRRDIRNHTAVVYSVSVPEFTINRIDLSEPKVWDTVWSPDQKQIVYHVEKGSTEESDYESAICIAPSKGGNSNVITRSSDVTYIFWVRPYENTYRLFIKEHRRKTAEGALELFSPDGSHLATLAKFPTPGLTALSADGSRCCLLERKEKRLRVYRLEEPGTRPKIIKLPDELDSIKFSGKGYALIGWGSAWGRGVPRQLWLIDTDSMKIRRIGKREWYPAFQGSIEWMPNGKEILVSSRDKLWIVDIASGAKRQVWQFPDKYKRMYSGNSANIE